MTPPGGPYTWDLTTLTADTRYETVFQPAANGSAAASFPDAELVIIADVGAETYYDVSATAVSGMGFSGGDVAGGLPFASTFVFNPPLAELHAPMTFPNIYNGLTTFGFTISTDQIPSEILDSLGVPSGLLDSIRLKVNISRADFVDAYGTMMIPGGTYEVLREKRTDITETRLEIHTFLGWQDVTDLLPIDGFGQDTAISYLFLSNTEKLPIAVFNMDTTGLVIGSVDFKDNGAPSALDPGPGHLADIRVSPNPVSHSATFDLSSLPTGTYTLQVFDTGGKCVSTHSLAHDQNSVNLYSLHEGVYVYRISGSQHQILATGRIVKTD